MAVGSMGSVLSAASNFLSLAALRPSAAADHAREAEPAAVTAEPGSHDVFTSGSAAYEAVAEALGRAGYLDA